MSERKLVPHIRFMNFDSEWNTVKLSRLLNVYDGVHQTPTYTKSGVPFVSVENIRNLKTNKYISKNDFDLQFKSSKPACGDLLMTRIGDIGTVNIIKSDGDLAYYVSLALLKPKAKSCKNVRNSYYLMYLVESPRVKKELWKRTLHIAFPKKINKNEISKITICTSSDIGEQQKIGGLFSKLDRLLDLQQQKLDLLKLLKKALLQKLFPKQGAKIPELRFKGFAEEWKKDTIGEIARTKSGGTPSVNNKKYYDGNIPFIRSSDINKTNVDLKINDEAVSNSSAFVVEKGNILYALYGATSGQVAISRITGAVNQAILAIFPKQYINKMFLMYWLSYNKEKITTKYLQGGQGNLSAKLIKKLLITFPLKDEQQKIGNLLAKIDRLIELENKKFSNLKQVKKALLQNMFVE